MSLPLRIRADLVDALKKKEAVRAAALRLLLSSMRNAEIEKRGPLSEEDVLAQVAKAIRIRKEAIEGCVKSGREDLKQKEETEMKVLESYLPAQMGEAELMETVSKVIEETGALGPADMGKVMKALMPRVSGRVDGAKASQLVRQSLSAKP